MDIFYELMKDGVIGVGVDLFARKLAYSFREYNSDLTDAQIGIIQRMIVSLISRYRAGGSILRSIQGIVALAAPGNNDLVSLMLRSIKTEAESEDDSESTYNDSEDKLSSFRGNTTGQRQVYYEMIGMFSSLFNSYFFPHKSPEPSDTSSFTFDHPATDDGDVSDTSQPEREERSSGSTSYPRSPSLSDVEFSNTKHMDSVGEQLVAFGIPKSRVLRIPIFLRPALLAALEDNPTCCISMEDLTTTSTTTSTSSTSQSRNRLIPNVVVLFELGKDGGPHHAYLFEQASLNSWFHNGGGAERTNPFTRSEVDVQRQCFLLTKSNEDE